MRCLKSGLVLWFVSSRGNWRSRRWQVRKLRSKSPSTLRHCATFEDEAKRGSFRELKNIRSSAGHLAKQSRALRHLLGRHHALGSVLLRRSGHGGGRAVLLRGGSRSGRARRGAADGALTRHFCGCFSGGFCCGEVREMNRYKKARF